MAAATLVARIRQVVSARENVGTPELLSRTGAGDGGVFDALMTEAAWSGPPVLAAIVSIPTAGSQSAPTPIVYRSAVSLSLTRYRKCCGLMMMMVPAGWVVR